MSRITVLTTRTVNTRVFYEPLFDLGHQVSLVVYDVIDPARMDHLPQWVRETRPDWVLYIGAIPGHHDHVPSADVLTEIGHQHKTVLLCCDGAEPAWWPHLREFFDRGTFALQVNIDGVRTGPIGEREGERGMTALCPVSFARTCTPSWSQRPIDIGFPGGPHGRRRAQMVQQLVSAGLLVWRQREETPRDEYWDFLLQCWCIWNNPETGGMTSRHVKARVLEAALAGCVVLEEKNSPLSDWFEEGRDYLTYETVADVAAQRNFFRSCPVEARLIAERLATKVRRQHSPAVFWRRVEANIRLAEPHAVPATVPEFREYVASDPPQLLRSHGGLNLVAFAKAYYVAPQHLGEIDFGTAADRTRPGVRKFATEEAARAVMGV